MHEVPLTLTARKCVDLIHIAKSSFGEEAPTVDQLSEDLPWAFIEQGNVSRDTSKPSVWKVAFVFFQLSDAIKFKLST